MNANRKSDESRVTHPAGSVPVQYPRWIDVRDYWPAGYPWRPGIPRFLEAGPLGKAVQMLQAAAAEPAPALTPVENVDVPLAGPEGREPHQADRPDNALM